MVKLLKTLNAWNTDVFGVTLKEELQELGAELLPLDQATSQGGVVDVHHITVLILHAFDAGAVIHATVGIFFTEIVPSCGCPIEPMEEETYCKVQVMISKSDAETEFNVIPT